MLTGAEGGGKQHAAMGRCKALPQKWCGQHIANGQKRTLVPAAAAHQAQIDQAVTAQMSGALKEGTEIEPQPVQGS